MCQFVRLVKGVNYIQEVQEVTRRTNTLDNQPNHSMTIEEAMLTAPVRLALEMGVDGGVIRNETLRKINQTGCPYETIEDLLKAVFDDSESNEGHSTRDTNQASYGSDCTGDVNAISINTTSHSSAEEQGESSAATTCNPDASVEPSISESNCTQKTHEIDHEESKDGVVSSISASNDTLTADRLSLEEENRKLKDARLCKICLDEEVAVVYLPCGHLGSYNLNSYYRFNIKN